MNCIFGASWMFVVRARVCVSWFAIELLPLLYTRIFSVLALLYALLIITLRAHSIIPICCLYRMTPVKARVV